MELAMVRVPLTMIVWHITSKLSGVKQTTNCYEHGFCGTGIWTGYSKAGALFEKLTVKLKGWKGCSLTFWG